METTDEDKTDIQILSEYAKRTGREIYYNEKPYNSSRAHRYPKFRTEIFIPNNPSETSFFACLYDTYRREGENAVFSGTFIPVSSLKTVKFIIREKNILDRLSNIFGNKSYQTGNANFDSKVVIESENHTLMPKYLGNIKFQNLVLDSFKIRKSINISLNSIRADFIPGLKGKSQLCVYDKQGWFLERSEIDKLFDIIGAMQNIVN